MDKIILTIMEEFIHTTHTAIFLIHHHWHSDSNVHLLSSKKEEWGIHQRAQFRMLSIYRKKDYCKTNGGHPSSYHFSYFDGILSQSTAPIAVALACQREGAAFTDFKHESNYRCFLI